MKDRPECSIERLIEIVAELRGPDGCPWDKAQTTNSLKPYLIEECHEFLAVADGPDADDIRDELGDLLLQVVLHARIFEEQGLFTLDDAAASICGKMIRRHPHVFSGQQQQTMIDLDLQWERIKSDEKLSAGKTPGISEPLDSDLPILQSALKISKKAARIGLDWPDARSVLKKVREELDELEEAIDANSPDTINHELGDLLFATANLARHLNLDTELSLRQSLVRFTNRVQYIEKELRGQDKTFSDINIQELDRLWESAKMAEQDEKIT